MSTATLEPSTIQGTNGITAYHGRWGWHPCDYATFLLVKRYHWLSLVDYKTSKRARLWNNRLPHNRKGSEPRTGLDTAKGHYQLILAAYQTIRKPCEKPEDVETLGLPRKWRTRLAELEVHYAEAK